MNHVRYSIGQFSQLCGLSIKTLRYYDKLGLLEPAAVHPHNRYRLYTPEQLHTVNRIVAPQAAGLTLREISAYGTDGLEHARTRFTAQIEQARSVLQHIDTLLELRSASVALKMQPEMRVATVSERLDNYDDVDALLQELASIVPAASRGSAYGAQWTNCRHDSVVCQAFVELKPDTPVASLRQTRVETLRPMQTAALVVNGQVDGSFERGYAMLHRWIDRMGFAPAGNKFEFYLTPLGEPTNSVTEIRFPLA